MTIGSIFQSPIENYKQSMINAAGQAGQGGVKGVEETECQTCKNRKYVDGSDENVSFKSPAHVAPQAAGAAVRGHEAEHVSNAYTKAAKGKNGVAGKVINASVSIKMAVCPECGRSYVAGGVTNTSIKYSEDNKYSQNMKAYQAEALKGNNVDMKL